MAQHGIDFVTLGMFIIDDIYPAPDALDQTPRLNVIGGAGTYSVIGARFFSPAPTKSRAVSFIVDEGNDFPRHLRSVIASWQTGALIRSRAGPTTRGWNGYSGNEHRDFKYLTEKKRLTADDLNMDLLASKSFHLICSPLRCIDQVQSILQRRREAFGAGMRAPMFIWEPVPDLCIPSELQNTYAALKYVDVVSPNHDELASIFGSVHPAELSKSVVEHQAQRLIEAGIGTQRKGAVVIRAGASGCFVLDSTSCCWLPAYHQDAAKVLDPTGGGNGFLGGLSLGLVNTDFDVLESARWGSVSASLCIEQVGVPRLEGDEEHETWNGIVVLDRLKEFRDRTISKSGGSGPNAP